MAFGPDTSYQEAMTKILADIARAGTLPGADLQFNTQLQMAITQFVKTSAVDAATATMNMGPDQQMAPPPQMAGPGPGGGMEGLSLSAAMNPGPPQGGAPNADELRRMLSGV